jgi:outer membrane protein TolC
LEVVKTKSEVAKSSMQNIIKVEVELTMIRDNLVKLKSKENSIVAEMNAILLRDESRPILTDSIKIKEHQLFDTDDILSLAKENQPSLREIRLSEKKSALMEIEAKYGFYPNFSIGVQYSQREYNKLSRVDYNDFLSVMAGISLPINYGGKKTAKINEAKYLQILYKEKYNSAIQDLSSSINVIVTKIEELINRNDIISKSLLPLSEQSLQVALSDYQVDKIDFINVINAEKEILDVKTELYRIQTEYDQNVVMLEYLAGSEFQAELRSMEN